MFSIDIIFIFFSENLKNVSLLLLFFLMTFFVETLLPHHTMIPQRQTLIQILKLIIIKI